MKTKTKILLLVLLGVYICASILVVVFYVIPRQDALFKGSWYEKDINEVARQYIEQIAPGSDTFTHVSYSYSYDKENAGDAGETSANSYPFSEVKMTLRCGKTEYTLYIEKNDAGELVVREHTSKEVWFPFGC